MQSPKDLGIIAQLLDRNADLNWKVAKLQNDPACLAKRNLVNEALKLKSMRTAQASTISQPCSPKRSGFDIWDTAPLNPIIPLNIPRFEPE